MLRARLSITVQDNLQLNGDYHERPDYRSPVSACSLIGSCRVVQSPQPTGIVDISLTNLSCIISLRNMVAPQAFSTTRMPRPATSPFIILLLHRVFPCPRGSSARCSGIWELGCMRRSLLRRARGNLLMAHRMICTLASAFASRAHQSPSALRSASLGVSPSPYNAGFPMYLFLGF